MRTVSIILAAGQSSRMGQDKAFLPWPSSVGALSTRPLLQVIVESAGTVSARCIVVTGSNHDKVAGIVAGEDMLLVRNPAPERGMFSSLQCGATKALVENADAALVFHVDRPPVGSETLLMLARTIEDQIEIDGVAVIPSYHGTHGHPYGVDRTLLENIAQADASSNARDLLKSQGRIIYVECDDAAVVANLNTPADYEHAIGLNT